MTLQERGLLSVWTLRPLLQVATAFVANIEGLAPSLLNFVTVVTAKNASIA